MKKAIPLLILLFSLLLAACQPAATVEPTMDLTQVAESVNATLAAEAPTPTPVPTEVPPTETPLPTPTPLPIQGDPAILLGEPDGVDTFDSDANWTLFDNQCFKSEITDGKYLMTAKGLEGVICWEVSWPEIKDFYYEATLDMPEQCQPNDRFGLFFRAPDNDRGYLYGLTCDGRYSMTMWDGEATTVIVEPTPSEMINTGPDAVNRIGVVAYGGSYLLYANGEFLTEAQNYTFTQPGKLGLFVRASTDQSFVVEYDNLGVWVLDDRYYPPSYSPPTGTLPTPEPGSATVTTITYVNVRSGPSTQYPIYFVAAPGATGQAVGISEDGAWYAITLPTTISGTGTGWISATYVVPANTENLPVVPAPSLPPGVEPPPPDPTAPTVTNFEPINVRSGPGNQYPSYGVVSIGSAAEVVGISEDGIWYAVSIPTDIAPDGVGWVNVNYVTLSNPSDVNIPVLPAPDEGAVATPPPDANVPTITTTDVVNIRSGPGTDYPSYGVAPIGTTAIAIGISPDSGWYNIQIPAEISSEGTGWVNANYVTAENTENLPVVQPPPLP